MSSSTTTTQHAHRRKGTVKRLLKVPQANEAMTRMEQAVIVTSSLVFVGSLVWVPVAYTWMWKRWNSIPKQQRKRRAVLAALLLSATALVVWGPHRSFQASQKYWKLREWKLWKIWIKFMAMEVLLDTTTTSAKNVYDTTQQAILAFCPHGLFPFAIGGAGVPSLPIDAFGVFRKVVATATTFLPIIRDIISMTNAVDASRSSVHQALQEGSRLGVVPGGIQEMFCGYPNRLEHPNDEYSIVPMGFLKMAYQYQIPVRPIYCFGATKMLKRVPLPTWITKLSMLLRTSLVLFFGVYGLPIPFRQKLLYVMGNPIIPPPRDDAATTTEVVQNMHQEFCEELMRLFENHKEDYGWGHKSLYLLSRSPVQ